jgi:hypothetical protein
MYNLLKVLSFVTSSVMVGEKVLRDQDWRLVPWTAMMLMCAAVLILPGRFIVFKRTIPK